MKAWLVRMPTTPRREPALAQRVFGLFDTYESHVLSTLKTSAGARADL